METLFLDYLLKSSVILTLLYIPYFLFLKNETFFSLNRNYLLFALVATVVLPFVPLPQFFEQSSIPEIDFFIAYGDAVGSAALPQTQEKVFEWTLTTILLLIYAIGVLVGLVRLVAGLFTIVSLIKKGEKKYKDQFVLVYLDKDVEPFSFLKWVFISSNNNFSENEEAEIIAHECAHVQQKHSFDVFVIELLGLILWFNPMIYAYRKAICNTHEYLADAATVTYFTSKKDYLNLLINQHFMGKNLPFVTKFHHYSLLKKRVTMLTKSPSKKVARLKLFLAVPALLLCVLLTSCLKEYVEISERSELSSSSFVFPNDYTLEKSYQVRRTSSLELDFTNDKTYMFRMGKGFEGVKITLYDEKGEMLSTNFLQERYFNGFTYLCSISGKYRLDIEIPFDKKDTELAIATRPFKRNDKTENSSKGSILVKTYTIKEQTEEYTMVLAAGTSYRFEIESKEDINFQLHRDGQDTPIFDYTPKKEQELKAAMTKIDSTGIYFMRINKTVPAEPAEIKLYFFRR